MLILQNEMPESTNLAAARAAHGRGVPVCLNAAPVRESSDELKQLIDLLVVNQVEAEGFCGKKVADLEAALQAARELLERFPQVVVTAGGSGVAYAARRGDSGTLPAHRVKVISTHGAGDCFVGHLCAALVRGAGLSEAVVQANEASARHVSTPQVS